MKNKWLIILLAVVVVAGGAYFLTREKADIPDDIGDNSQEEPTGPEEPADPEEPIDSDKPEDLERDDDIEIGKLPPAFTYKAKDGQEISLTNLQGQEVDLDDYKGKFVWLNFWGTWCKWCDVEMPDLDKFDKDNDDLVVLAVNVQENKDTVQKYMDKGGYEFEVVLDPEGQIARKYLVASFPITYFIDKDGIFLGGHEGAMDYEKMEAYLGAIKESTQ